MNGSNNARTGTDIDRLQEQQTQQHSNSGEGSGSAMTAMLKKRRQGENHADQGPESSPDQAAAER